MSAMTTENGLGHERIIHTYTQRGEFTSDVTQLSSKPAVVDAHVVEDVEAILLRPDELSAMMISEADLGEKIMRALILRRVLVIERGHGVVLVGPSSSGRLATLQNFLQDLIQIARCILRPAAGAPDPLAQTRSGKQHKREERQAEQRQSPVGPEYDYQQADGAIAIPAALVPYMGSKTRIG